MNRKFFLSALALIAICIGAYRLYSISAANQKIELARQQLRTVSMRDNILLAEVLSIEKSAPTITPIEYLEKLKNNREERDELKRKAESIESYNDKAQLSRYISLLDLENEYIRAEEVRVRQMAAYTSSYQRLGEATRQGNEAIERVKAGQASLISESEIERMMARSSERTVDPTAASAIKYDFEKLPRKSLSQSGADLSVSLIDCMVASDDLVKEEKADYPAFLPARDLANQVQAKKKIYSNIQASVKSTRAALYLD